MCLYISISHIRFARIECMHTYLFVSTSQQVCMYICTDVLQQARNANCKEPDYHRIILIDSHAFFAPFCQMLAVWKREIIRLLLVMCRCTHNDVDKRIGIKSGKSMSAVVQSTRYGTPSHVYSCVAFARTVSIMQYLQHIGDVFLETLQLRRMLLQCGDLIKGDVARLCNSRDFLVLFIELPLQLHYPLVGLPSSRLPQSDLHAYRNVQASLWQQKEPTGTFEALVWYLRPVCTGLLRRTWELGGNGAQIKKRLCWSTEQVWRPWKAPRVFVLPAACGVVKRASSAPPPS